MGAAERASSRARQRRIGATQVEEQLVTVEAQPEPFGPKPRFAPRPATRLLKWLRKIRDRAAGVFAGDIVKVPCVVCLKLYSFRLNQHLEHRGKGHQNTRHYGMFCSQNCLIEYCRIMVKSAKASQMEAAGRAVFKEERRNGKGTGTYTPIAATKRQPVRKGRKHAS